MATEDITKAANKETAERLKTINSVTGQVGRLRSDMNKKLDGVEKSSKKVSNMTNDNLAKLSKDMENVKKDVAKQNANVKSISHQKGVREVQSSLNVMLRSLGKSVDYMSQGVKKTSLETAKISSDAIGQYGKAISEDISVNKQNTVAMALARTTPLFGYFAGKFMETDVYRGFTDKIKGKFVDASKEIGTTLKGLARHGFEKIKDIRYIGKKKELMEKYSPKEANIKAEAEKANKKELMEKYSPKEAGKASKKELMEKYSPKEANIKDEAGKASKKHKSGIPHLAEGGIVKKTGLAKVHKGEVVSSVTDLLDEVDQRANKRDLKDEGLKSKIVRAISMLTEKSAQTETYVGKREKSQRGILKDFIRSYATIKNPSHHSMQERMLKALLELKVSLVGMTSRLQLAWQETLIQHPTFRNILSFSSLLKKTFEFPLRFLFTAKGGYMSEIKKVTRGSNVFNNMIQALCLIYSKWSPKIDTIKENIKLMAETMHEKGGKDKKEKLTTRWKELKDLMTRSQKHGLGKAIMGAGKKGQEDKIGGLWGMYARSMGLDEDDLRDAGLGEVGGLGRPGDVMERAGMGEVGHDIEFARRAKRKSSKHKLKGHLADIKGGLGLGKKKPPHMAAGGAIKKSGLIKAHAGEFVVSNKYIRAFIESFQRFQSFVIGGIKVMLEKFNQSEERKDKIFQAAKKEKKGSKTVFKLITWPLGILVKTVKNLTKFTYKMATGIWKIATWPIKMMFKLMRKTLKYTMKTVGFLGKIAFWPVKKIFKLTFKFTRWAFKWGRKAMRKLAGWGWKAIMFGLGIIKTMFKGTAKLAYGALLAIPALLGPIVSFLPIIAGVMGIKWAISDTKKAISKKKEWGVKGWQAGIGGFLGGASDRKGKADIAKDAAKGAVKGAAIGAGIGTIVPVFGTAIGGAVGAIAGGILGAIGGKNIAQGIKVMSKEITILSKAVFSFVTWPLRMVWKIIKWAKNKMMNNPMMRWIGKKLGKDTPKMDDDIAESAMNSMFADTPTEKNRQLQISKTELARKQADTEARRINGITGPLLKSERQTREEMVRGNAETIAQINNNTSAVQSSNNNTTTINSDSPNIPADDNVRRIIEGDLQ